MDMATNFKMGMGAAETTAPIDFGLSALDWRVVALARTEADRIGARAFRARGAVGCFLDRLTGIETGARRLADDRLEALRRFVGLARRRDRQAAAAGATLVAMGMAAPVIELLRAAASR